MQLAKINPDQSVSESMPLLTYCTNIHAGEEWSELHRSLMDCVPKIRQQLGCSELGVGLRLGQQTVQALADPINLNALRQLLRDEFSLFTVNAFPYGKFHGEPVKENVYEPDWSTTERLTYTVSIAKLLGDLLTGPFVSKPGNPMVASISTVPGAFKPRAIGQEEAIRSNLIKCVAELVRIKRATGLHIALALEPEPFCMLETIAETVSWFESYGFCQQSRQQLSSLIGVSESTAEDLLRSHIGVCYDVCHAAVEFEDARQSFDALQKAGISIPKIQLSSALRIAQVDLDIAQKLASFDEPVYLHQVVQREVKDGQSSLTRFLDLPDAIRALERGEGIGSEWRIHFHVPVFMDHLEHFDTTQFFLREVLELVRQTPQLSPHLEVETYTWDVLPNSLRTTDISTSIAREMQWVLDELKFEASELGLR